MWSHFLILSGRSSYNVYFHHCYFLVTEVLFTCNFTGIIRIMASLKWCNILFALNTFVCIRSTNTRKQQGYCFATHVWTEWGEITHQVGNTVGKTNTVMSNKHQKVRQRDGHSLGACGPCWFYQSNLEFPKFLWLSINNKITAHVSDNRGTCKLHFQILPNKLF